jgi:transposase
MGDFIRARIWSYPTTLFVIPAALLSRAQPIEHLWQSLKADLKWAAFKTLEQLQTKIDQLLAALTPEVIASITATPSFERQYLH